MACELLRSDALVRGCGQTPCGLAWKKGGRKNKRRVEQAGERREVGNLILQNACRQLVGCESSGVRVERNKQRQNGVSEPTWVLLKFVLRREFGITLTTTAGFSKSISALLAEFTRRLVHF